MTSDLSNYIISNSDPEPQRNPNTNPNLESLIMDHRSRNRLPR